MKNFDVVVIGSGFSGLSCGHFLKEEGILAGVHYRLPVHLHPAYRSRITKSKDMSVTESIIKKIISLPILSH